MKQKDNKTLVSQYEIPHTADSVSTWQPLTDFQATGYQYGPCFQAKTRCGKQLYANQSYQLINDRRETLTFWPFSSDNDHHLTTATSDKIKQQNEYTPVGRIKGGYPVMIDPKSVKLRWEKKVKIAKVNKSKLIRAVEQYQRCLTAYDHWLTSNHKHLLIRALQADKHCPEQKHLTPEKLHLTAKCLSHIDEDPQSMDNLGCGPFWANTAMLIFETIALHYATHHPEIKVTIQPAFLMLFTSEVIAEIHYQINLTLQNSTISLSKKLDLMNKHQAYVPLASDIAQLTYITSQLINRRKPTLDTMIPSNL